MGTLSAEKPIDFVKRGISKIFTVLLQLRIDTAIKCPEAEAMDCLYLVRSSVLLQRFSYFSIPFWH